MLRPMKHLCTMAMILFASGPAIAGEREDRAMDRVEQAVKLPPEAAPFASYARLYAWSEPGRTIMVLYTRALSPGRQWVASNAMPVAIGQGCDVIVFDYDLKMDLPKKTRMLGGVDKFEPVSGCS